MRGEAGSGRVRVAFLLDRMPREDVLLVGIFRCSAEVNGVTGMIRRTRGSGLARKIF